MKVSLRDLLRCICKERECQQKGQVRWNSDDGKYVHTRIDGCVVKSNQTEKCDCLLFHFPENSTRTVIFFVEVKGRSYDLGEVKTQIEKTIALVEQICADIRDRIMVPVCYADRHPKDHERFIVSYRVSSSRGPLVISLLNYGDDIKKALRCR